MNDSSFNSYLASNPRMVGVLFTLTVLLSQAGSVVASNCSAYSGP